MAGLKITTPALFDIVPIQRNHTQYVRSYMPDPNVVTLQWQPDGSGLSLKYFELVSKAGELIPLFSQIHDDGASSITSAETGIPAPGLSGNVIHSILGESVVNASDVAVAAFHAKVTYRVVPPAHLGGDFFNYVIDDHTFLQTTSERIIPTAD